MRRRLWSSSFRLALASVVGFVWGVVLWWNPSPAAADFVFGCPVPGGSTSPGSEFDLANMSVSADWSLSDGSTGSETAALGSDAVYLDVNGDSANDARVTVYGFTGWVNYSSWGTIIDQHSAWRSDAILEMANNTHANELVSERFGVDYSTLSTKQFDSWLYQGNMFGQIAVHLKFNLIDDPAAFDPVDGIVTANVQLPRVGGGTDSYRIALDTTGATGTATDWPEIIHAVLFIDTEFANLATLGVTTALPDSDGDGADEVVPHSNLSVGAVVEQVEGDPLGLDLKAGHTGTYSANGGTITSVGHPGASAIAARIECDDEHNPFDHVAAGYDPAPLGTESPQTQDFDMSVYGEGDADADGVLDPEERTLFADFTMPNPPSGMDARIAASDADLDGDGTDDGSDVDGDGTVDLPWNTVEFTREADTDPSAPAGLRGVLASTPPAASPGADLYAAVETDDLPAHVIVDAAGTPVLDASSGEATTTLDLVDARTCDGEWGSAECAGTSEPSAPLRFDVGTELVDGNGDGNPDRLEDNPYEALSPAPAGLAATQAGHFVPTAPHFVAYTDDAATAAWSAAGYVTGFTHASLDDRTTLKASVAAAYTGAFGLEAHLQDDEADVTGIWGVLQKFPQDVTVQLVQSDDDGDGVDDHLTAAWDIATRTVAALAADLTPSDPGGSQTHVETWFGTGTQASTGLATSTDIEVVSTDNHVGAEVGSNASTVSDVGITTSTEVDRAAGLRKRIRAQARIPNHLEVAADIDPATKALEHVEAGTCQQIPVLPCPAMNTITLAAERASGSATDAPLLVPMDTSFPAAAPELMATRAQHYDPNPPHFLEYAHDEHSDTTTDDDTWSLSGVLKGLQFVTVDLDGDEIRGRVRNTGLVRFGVSAELTDDDTQGGYQTEIWGVLADAPSDLRFTYAAEDTDTNTKGNEKFTFEWDISNRTGVAFAADLHEPEGQDAKQRTHASGWIGTGTGTLDGLNDEGSVTADFAGNAASVVAELGHGEWAPWPGPGPAPQPPAPTPFEVGVTTSTAAERAAGLRVRGHVAATVPEALDAYWRKDAAGTVERADVFTCHMAIPPWANPPVPQEVCAPLQGLAATVVKDRISGGETVDDPALTGVTMLPIPGPSPANPDAYPFEAAGNDFTSAPEFLHYVTRRTPQQNALEVSPDEGEWGVDVAIGSVGQVSFAASRQSLGLYRRSDICLDAQVADRFGLGFFSDDGDGTAGTWADGLVDFDQGNPGAIPPGTLDTQIEIGLPWDVTANAGEGGTALGNLNLLHLLFAGQNPLMRLLRVTCPGHSGHSFDPAPIVGNPDPPDADMNLQIRSGTHGQVVDLMGLEPAPIAVPAGYATDAALRSTDNTTVVDAAARWVMPHSLHMNQPLMQVCGNDGNTPATCNPQRTYDAEYLTLANLNWTSVGADFGDLDAYWISDTAPASGGGEAPTYARLHSNDLPEDFGLSVLLRQRPRDNYLDVDASMTDLEGNDLPNMRIEYWDAAHPAHRGDESEQGGAFRTDNAIPNYKARLHGLTDTIHVSGQVFMPTYGWAPVYDTADCDFTDPAQNDHVYPFGDDPRLWETIGPRPWRQVRPMYVDADLDMQNAATEVDVNLEARVDGTDQADDYDSETSSITRMRFDSDEPVEGEIDTLIPGMRTYQTEGLDKVKIFGMGIIHLDEAMEACMDADIPVEATITDLSRLGLGLDTIKATVTADEGEVNAGGNAAVRFQETFRDATGTETTAEGMWVHELLTHFNPPLKDWYTRVVDDRKTIGIVDTADPGNNAGSIPQTTADLADMTDPAQWSGTDSNGDEVWTWFGIDPLFHEDVENEFSTRSSWNGMWGNIDDLPELSDTGDGWVYPTSDPSATADDFSDTFTTTCVFVGENQEFHGQFGSTSDGTTFEIATRHGGAGRIEILLVGYYASGEVRFVHEITDQNLGGSGLCDQWDVEVDLDAESHADEGVVTIEIDAHRGGRLDIDGLPLDLDVSGNVVGVPGYSSALTVTHTDGDGDGAIDKGEAVLLASGFDPVDDLVTDPDFLCYWYTGDGTRKENLDGTLEFTYGFPGDYRAAQVCFDKSFSNDPLNPLTLYNADLTIQ